MIYLIGGVSRSGKSVLARRVADITKCSVIHVDDFVQAGKAGAVEGWDFNSLTGDHQRAEVLFPLVKSLVQTALSRSNGVCFEGVSLLPKYLAELKNLNPDKIKILFMAYPDITPTAKVEQFELGARLPNNWAAGLDDQQKYDYAAGGIKLSQAAEKECATHQVPFISMRLDFDADILKAQDILGIISRRYEGIDHA